MGTFTLEEQYVCTSTFTQNYIIYITLRHCNFSSVKENPINTSCTTAKLF